METVLDKDGAKVIVYRGWYDQGQKLYASLEKEVKWECKEVVIYGKKIPQPRLIAYCGDKENTKHNYSGLSLSLPSFSSFPQGKEIKNICDKINTSFNCCYDSCLLNYYRDGKDYISYHSDKEGKEHIKTVATLSLGASRRFYLKSKYEKETIKTVLNDGDLCLMLGRCQELYTHSIPKQAKVKGRISLTFRKLST